MEIGYHLSSEEHGARDLIRFAQRAEDAGVGFALVSDHYHPWTSRQGHSPFVWATLGGIAQATERLPVGTGVTCPTIRIHPAIVAQAAATVATMMPGRFFLGLGTGENLNEHILGDKWPAADERLEMLAEAITVIRLLWQGGEHTHRGEFYVVEDATIFDLPEQRPEIMVAAWGDKATELAARLGDGLISTSPDRDMIRSFDDAGGHGKPRYGKITVCYALSDDEARRIAAEWWPNTSTPGDLGVELATPERFDAAAQLVTEDMIAEKIVCSADPERHLAEIRSYFDAGYDRVFVHQVGPDQDAFFDFYEQNVLPKV